MQLKQLLNEIIEQVGKQADFSDIELSITLSLHRELSSKEEKTFAVGFSSPPQAGEDSESDGDKK